jgi:hypothetical protein
MALTISFVASGAGLNTFTTAGSALVANQRITGGIGSVANNVLNIVCNSTQSPAVTAYVTGAAFSQSLNGAPIFTAQGQDSAVFIFASSQSYTTPVRLASNLSQTIAFALTAVGAECAQGVQTGTITLTLSSVALTGAAVRVNAETSSTINIPVTAVNTANDTGTVTCDAEARRLWVLGYN